MTSRLRTWHQQLKPSTVLQGLPEVYDIASKARSKPAFEADRGEHRLRFLVGHANLLVRCRTAHHPRLLIHQRSDDMLLGLQHEAEILPKDRKIVVRVTDILDEQKRH